MTRQTKLLIFILGFFLNFSPISVVFSQENNLTNDLLEETLKKSPFNRDPSEPLKPYFSAKNERVHEDRSLPAGIFPTRTAWKNLTSPTGRDYLEDQFEISYWTYNTTNIDYNRQNANGELETTVYLPGAFYKPQNTAYWSRYRYPNETLIGSANNSFVLGPSQYYGIAMLHDYSAMNMHQYRFFITTDYYRSDIYPLYENIIYVYFDDNRAGTRTEWPAIYLWGTRRANERILADNSLLSLGTYQDQEAGSRYYSTGSDRLPTWKYHGYKITDDDRMMTENQHNRQATVDIRHYRNEIDHYYEPNLEAAKLDQEVKNLTPPVDKNVTGDSYELTVKLTVEKGVTEDFDYPFKTTLPANLRVAPGSEVKVRRKNQGGQLVEPEKRYKTTTAANAASYLERSYTGVADGGSVEVVYQLEPAEDYYPDHILKIESQIQGTGLQKTSEIPQLTFIEINYLSDQGEVLAPSHEQYLQAGNGSIYRPDPLDLTPQWLYQGYQLRDGSLVEVEEGEPIKRPEIVLNREKNNLDFIYKSNKAVFTAEFVDEDGKKIQPAYSYQAVAGEVLDLEQDPLL